MKVTIEALVTTSVAPKSYKHNERYSTRWRGYLPERIFPGRVTYFAKIKTKIRFPSNPIVTTDLHTKLLFAV